MSFTLPFNPELPHQRLTVTLGGVSYIMDARWNTRESAWYLDLFDAVESPIEYGAKVVLGFPLFVRCPDERKFTGTLIAVDTSGAYVSPGISDLGGRVQILYTPA